MKVGFDGGGNTDDSNIDNNNIDNNTSNKISSKIDSNTSMIGGEVCQNICKNHRTSHLHQLTSEIYKNLQGMEIIRNLGETLKATTNILNIGKKTNVVNKAIIIPILPTIKLSPFNHPLDARP